jgi:hypothetical protein
MTYRELLEAIQVGEELQRALDHARSNPKRFKGTLEEQDEADALMRIADRALDEEISS